MYEEIEVVCSVLY
jgi:hypothetical protein